MGDGCETMQRFKIALTVRVTNSGDVLNGSLSHIRVQVMLKNGRIYYTVKATIIWIPYFV